jgi:serine protease Do
MTRWRLAFVGLLVGGFAGSLVGIPLLRGQGRPSAVPAIPKELTSYRDVVKTVLPAVVSIEAKLQARPVTRPKQPEPRRPLPFDQSQLPEEFRKFFDDFGRIPLELPDRLPMPGTGSGFVVDPNGVILTNYHVVAGVDQVEVELKDGRKFVSKDIKADTKTDLAIVRIDAKGLPALELGDSDAMEIGDRVLAVGAPFGLAGSVTHGIISGKGRNLRMNLYEDYLQTDAAINPGNSGGPLVNLEGKVIGINAAIKSRSGGFQGVGLAIPSNMARNVVQQLIKDGVVRRGYLGVQVKDLLDRDLAARLGLKPEQGGVQVTQVFAGSPGAKAGIQDGDVLTDLAGKAVREGRTLQQMVAGLSLGQPIDVTVMRDGKPLTLKVTIEEQPQDFGSARVPSPKAPRRDGSEAVSLEGIGAEVTDLTPELAEQLGYKDVKSGVVVTQVDPNGLAALAGLGRGVLIAKVNRQPVTTAAALRDAFSKTGLEQGVLLQVYSPQGGTSHVLLKKS